MTDDAALLLAAASADEGSSAPPPASPSARVTQLRSRMLRLAASPLQRLAATAGRARSIVPPPLNRRNASTGAARIATDDAPLPLLGIAAEVVWVDSAVGVRQARERLRSARFVGIDTEWCEDQSRGGSDEGAVRYAGVAQRLATIQLAAESPADEGGARDTVAYVIDAMCLSDDERAGAQEAERKAALRAELRGLLLWLLSDESAGSPQLVGFAFAGDAELLRQWLVRSSDADDGAALAGVVSEPDGCARTPIRRRVLDAQTLAVAYGVGSTAEQPGLRASCEELLGRTLSKAQRMSDWTARPLRPMQLEYAAADAVAPLRLRDRAFDAFT